MSYVKKRGTYGPNDPMWVIGCIDSHGAIRGRHCVHGAAGNSVMHGPADSVGKRWRWNIWSQEFLATRNPSNDQLSPEEHLLVTDWLVRKGYMRDHERS